jgi:VanZ family protein
MRFLFSIFSIAYIAGIFLFADSSMVSDLSTFNPYSLLHIPLYGILTVLLIFSCARFKIKTTNPINSTNPTNLLAIAGFIAFFVAMADEIHQAYIPGRDASITDVLLDMVGIILVLFFAFRLYKTRSSIIGE